MSVQEHRRLRELASMHFQSRCLHEACERGLFSELERSPGSAEELARRLHLHPQACRMLLDALTALALLQEREGLYSNAPIASRYLIEGTATDQGEMIAMYRRSMERWEKLAEALHCGHTPAPPSEPDPRFIHAMHCTASVHAPLVVEAVPRNNARRLLDLGGGPGTYSIRFLLTWPEAEARMLDLEPVVSIAQEYAEIAGVNERFEAVAGDYLESELGDGYDLVLLSNILHCNAPEGCQRLLKRAFACLRPGGRVVIHEFLRDGSLWPAVFALHMLLSTPGGDTYSESTLKGWLHEAGFGEPVVSRLEGTPSSVLVAARS
ncbi:methyltransferase domain-containing protein [bacterium CPR1]|nr:methyltransferase domain-containing protein [bacterium CPR1]